MAKKKLTDHDEIRGSDGQKRSGTVKSVRDHDEIRAAQAAEAKKAY
eukprot:COSAG01_NODE_1390_length_10496_cov_8.535116_15_plen_46_part_00